MEIDNKILNNLNEINEYCVKQIEEQMNLAFEDGSANVIVATYNEIKPFVEMLEYSDKIDDIIFNIERGEYND